MTPFITLTVKYTTGDIATRFNVNKIVTYHQNGDRIHIRIGGAGSFQVAEAPDEIDALISVAQRRASQAVTR